MISAITVIERERKWLNMTANWDKQMIRNFKKVITFEIRYLYKGIFKKCILRL